MAWPLRLQINAYLGGGKGASAPVPASAANWPLKNPPPKIMPRLKPGKPADPRLWADESIGWGIVARETEGFTPEQLAAGDDLPEPIRQLWKDRGNPPLLRYRDGWDKRFQQLRNYAAQLDREIGRSPAGVSPESIPRYLLIYGGPEAVPWELQFLLNANYAVGRIHLAGVELENYVTALRSGWKGSGAEVKRTLVWAVDQGGDDITAMMRDVVAKTVHEKLAGDGDLVEGAQFLDGPGNATAAKLAAALAEAKPGLVVTTSHGQTFPLDNLEKLGAGLGFPVDQDYASAGPELLMAKWAPDGAIWYAHACCSAGSLEETQFGGLTEAGSDVDRVLTGVAKLGSRVAPLPTALLGGKKPLRAFIGHVEPTFDWTLQNPDTNQSFSDSLQGALYTELYQPSPVGYAFRRWYEGLASLFASYDQDQRAFARGGNTRESMLKDALCARDLQSTVILGDPTVALPELP